MLKILSNLFLHLLLVFFFFWLHFVLLLHRILSNLLSAIYPKCNQLCMKIIHFRIEKCLSIYYSNPIWFPNLLSVHAAKILPGHSWTLQMSSIVGDPGQSIPPLPAFTFLSRVLILFPPPHVLEHSPIPHFKQSIAYGINGKLVSVPRHVEEGSFSSLEISSPKQRMEEKIVLATHPLFKNVTLKHAQVRFYFQNNN